MKNKTVLLLAILISNNCVKAVNYNLNSTRDHNRAMHLNRMVDEYNTRAYQIKNEINPVDRLQYENNQRELNLRLENIQSQSQFPDLILVD